MTSYRSPGIYVKEVSSGAISIAGVGTSTAGFIGVISSSAPTGSNTSPQTPSLTSPQPAALKSGADDAIASGDETQRKSFTFDVKPPFGDNKTRYQFFHEASTTDATSAAGAQPVALTVDRESFTITGGKANVTFTTAIPEGKKLLATYTPPAPSETAPSDQTTKTQAPTREVKLCTNFTEFQKAFVSGKDVPDYLEDAVYGFFRNGGARCFVTVVADDDVNKALDDFAAIDEIAIVAAPGITNKATLDQLSAHCQTLGDRFAIFDAPQNAGSITFKPGEGDLPGQSDYAALYYPWIQVLDPVTNQNKYVPPSGHIAGVYARVDAQRGVHKAPANEVMLGAIGLETALSRAKQDGLNPQGVNCIRNLNGNITVWGARTWGGDANGEFKYVNIRRLFNYLRESIDEGTQWVVFEPNSPELWARVRRSVTAFLTMVWRSGALFGATPQEAFFVQCDQETNSPEVRDAGQLIVKIGVAVVKPAEFVIFELSQWSGGK
ncbi:MAG TPA: phage tail sheath subtilisin-like domain-containing protein [Candidatus Obscuribacterales bacterium]